MVQYPEERVDYPDAFRGMPVLVQLDNGQPRCVACGLCEFACPTDCITIVPGELEGAGIERYPEQFDIDMSRCMFCGLCEEACPEEAIVMSREVEIGTFDARGHAVQQGAAARAREPAEAPARVPARRVRPRARAARAGGADARGPRLARACAACSTACRAPCVDTHAEPRRRHRDRATRTGSSRCMRFLRDDPELRFDMLTDLTCVDYLGRASRASRWSTTSTRSRRTTGCA